MLYYKEQQSSDNGAIINRRPNIFVLKRQSSIHRSIITCLHYFLKQTKLLGIIHFEHFY